MKELVKIIFKYAAYGLAIACVQLLAVLLIFYTFLPSAFYVFLQDFTINTLAALLIGAISFIGAIAYKFDRLNFGLQIALHGAIVLVVALPVALSWGLLSSGSPASYAIGVLVWIVLFVAIWLGFYLHDNSKIKKINDEIRRRGR